MGKKNRKKTTWRRLSLTGEEDGGAINEDNERPESQYSDESNELRHNYGYVPTTHNGRPPFYPHKNRGFPSAHYRYSRTPKVVYSTDPSAPFPQAQQSVDGEPETQDENYWPDDQFCYYPQYFHQFATPTLVLAPSYQPMQWHEDPRLPPDCQYYFCLTQPVPQPPAPPQPTSSPPSTISSGENEGDGSEQLQTVVPEEEVDAEFCTEDYAYQTMPMQPPPMPLPPPYVYPGPFLVRPYAYNSNDGYYWWNEHGPSRGRRRRRRGFIGGEGITYDRWPSRKDRSCDRLKIASVTNSGDTVKPSAMNSTDETHAEVQLSENGTSEKRVDDANREAHETTKPLVGDNPVNRSNSSAETQSQFPTIESPKVEASLGQHLPQVDETPNKNQTPVPVAESEPLTIPVLSPSEPLEVQQNGAEVGRLGQTSLPTATQQIVALSISSTSDEGIQEEQHAEMVDQQFVDNIEHLDNSEHSGTDGNIEHQCNIEASQRPQSQSSSTNQIQSNGLDPGFDKDSAPPKQIYESVDPTNFSMENGIKVQEIYPETENSESDHTDKLDGPELIKSTPETKKLEENDLPEPSETYEKEIPLPSQTSDTEDSSVQLAPPTQTDMDTEIAAAHGKIPSSNPFKAEMEKVDHSKPMPVPNGESAIMQVSSQAWSKECSSNASSVQSERHHYHQLEDPMKCSKYYQLCGEVDVMVDAEHSESPRSKPSVAASGGEIVMHEADDSASECGSEDVEMLGHRYETAAEKLYKTNALSLAVEMLNSNQQLPYDREFKPIIEGGITNPCYSNTQVLEGYYGQLKRKTSNGKRNQGSRNGIRKDVADSGIHTDESGDESNFRNTIHEDDEILFSRNQTGTNAFQYQPFGRRPRAEHSPLLYLRSKGPWNGCCCTIM